MSINYKNSIILVLAPKVSYHVTLNSDQRSVTKVNTKDCDSITKHSAFARENRDKSKLRHRASLECILFSHAFSSLSNCVTSPSFILSHALFLHATLNRPTLPWYWNTLILWKHRAHTYLHTGHRYKSELSSIRFDECERTKKVKAIDWRKVINVNLNF